MWTNKVTSVRQLARDYYNGEISQEEYRRERTLQLELISAGANPYGDDERTRPREDAVDADIGSPAQSDDESFVDKLKKLEWVDKIPNGRIVVPVAAGVILILFIWLLWPSGPAPQNAQVEPVIAEKTDVVVKKENSAKELVKNFLEKDDWSIASIADFVKVWDTMTDEEHDSARKARWFKALRDSIRHGILEQKALQDGGSDDSIQLQSEQEILLESFAGHLGIGK